MEVIDNIGNFNLLVSLIDIVDGFIGVMWVCIVDVFVVCNEIFC